MRRRRGETVKTGKECGVKCQFCSQPATVHLTDIVALQKKEIHLCQQCAEQHQLIHKQELNLPAILKSLIGQHLGPETVELARLTCPACGIKYVEFRAQGRLGCPHDYLVFRGGLTPLLQRIHRSQRHVGKTPHRSVLPPEQQAEWVELRRRLQTAIDREAYEEAARLRDLLRNKEATDESG
jgi:protein arginine kinase activator